MLLAETPLYHYYSLNISSLNSAAAKRVDDQRDGDDVGDAETIHVHFSNSASCTNWFYYTSLLAIPLFTTAQVIRGTSSLCALTSGGRFAAWSMALI